MRDKPDLLNAAVACLDAQDIVCVTLTQLRSWDVRIQPGKKILFLCSQHAQILFETLFQAGRCRLLVVGFNPIPNPIDLLLALQGIGEQTDIPTQATAHGRFLPLLKTPDKKHVGKHEGRKAGSRCGLFEG